MKNSRLSRIAYFIFSGTAIRLAFRWAVLTYLFFKLLFWSGGSGNYGLLPLVFIIPLFAFVAYMLSLKSIAGEYSKLKKPDLRTTHSYICNLDTEREYCLLLRPFGRDGYFYLPKKENWIHETLNPGRASVTIESIVARTLADTLEVETLALVDSNLDILPLGPEYLLADENWMTDVELLMERALLVVFVFPPKKGSTDFVDWEIQMSVRKGLSHRMLFLFPPFSRRQEEDFEQVLKTLIPLYPDLINLDMSLKPIAIYPGRKETTIWYETDLKTQRFIRKKEKSKPMYATAYRDLLLEFVLHIKSEVQDLELEQRYPYWQEAKRQRHRFFLVN